MVILRIGFNTAKIKVQTVKSPVIKSTSVKSYKSPHPSVVPVGSSKKKVPYLDHSKILKFYAYGCFGTAGLPLCILQFDFLMQHQISFQSYYQGMFGKQAARHEQGSLFFHIFYFPKRTL